MFTRETVERCTVSFFRKGWEELPDIRLVQVDGVRAVVKDWRPRCWWRRLLGRFLIGREHAFLRRLQGLRGVPRSYGLADSTSLAVEYLEGQPICDASAVPPAFSAELQTLVQALHQRGVAHGDLDQDDNILLLADGTPAIIDFGGAVAHTCVWPASAWYRLLQAHDLHCAYRLGQRLGQAATPAPPPPLAPWQEKLLRFFHKIRSQQPRRTHGVGVK